MAEEVRFELTDPVKGRQFSRLVQSTALPLFRTARCKQQVFNAARRSCLSKTKKATRKWPFREFRDPTGWSGCSC